MTPFMLSVIFITVPAVVGALNFNVTATSAAGGATIFECWQLRQPFAVSEQAGLRGTLSLVLGEVSSSLTYNVLPAGFEAPAHPAPSNQWVVLLSGIVDIILPETNEIWTFEGGKDGVLFAGDTTAISRQGHRSRIRTDSILMQIPTADGEIPRHDVLHSGACLARGM